MHTTIRHQYFFAHPAEDVWEYLTNAELMAQWLMPNDFEPIFGYDFCFKTRPLPQFNVDGIFHCKVLEIVPPKKLVYSWKAGPGDGIITLDSIVVWTLIEKDNGTELQLEHTGFKEIENFALYTGMNDGWAKNMQKINTLLNTAKHGTA